jgi:HNH endonuclease
MARNASKPSTEDSRARYEARGLRMWWTPDKGMLQLHGQLPDVLGATFEATITKLTEGMKPAKGQVWDSFEHRAADALVGLCAQPEVQDETPTLAPRPVLQVLVPQDGPAEIAGIPIADSLLEQLRANATIEAVLVDADGAPVAVGRRSPGLSPKIARAVLLRDGGRCRCCGRKGNHVHHLRPRSWGGSDDPSNLATVATSCHPDLVPHGPYALVGSPNVPGDLRKVHVDDLTAEQREQVGLPPPRAGPTRRE